MSRRRRRHEWPACVKPCVSRTAQGRVAAARENAAAVVGTGVDLPQSDSARRVVVAAEQGTGRPLTDARGLLAHRRRIRHGLVQVGQVTRTVEYLVTPIRYPRDQLVLV